MVYAEDLKSLTLNRFVGSSPTPGTMIFLQWSLFCAILTIVGVYTANKQSSEKNRILVIHVGILMAIALFSIIGVRLVWQPSLLSIAAVATATLISFLLLGRYGLLYATSTLFQEWSMLLAASYLASGYGIIVGGVLTALVFVLPHKLIKKDVVWKLPLLLAWPCASFFFYAWFDQPFLNIALHVTGGAILIYKRILYPHRQTAHSLQNRKD